MTDWTKNYLKKLNEEFKTYSEMIDVCTDSLILNNEILSKYNEHYFNLEVFSGSDYDEEEDEFTEVFQYYIITSGSAEFMAEYTDELIYYLPEFDMYLLGVTHFGTSWDGVPSNWKTIED